MKLPNSNTFCTIPFIHIYGTADGNIVPCCESQETIMNNEKESLLSTWNNQKYKTLRQQLLNNKKPNICKVCWHSEKNNITSTRQHWLNDEWNNFKDDIILNDDYSVENPPLWLETKVGNFCNLKCKMCSTWSSYKRAQDIDILKKYGTGATTKLLKPDSLYNQLMTNKEIWNHIKVLQFSGGEPIINQNYYDLLESIPKNLRSNIKLKHATNLTHLKYKNYDMIEIWKQFKSVSVKVSVDGIGDVYNYIRHGANFIDVDKNIDILKEKLPECNIGIGNTTQVYNVFQLPEFFKHFESKGYLNFIENFLLQTPKYLNISVLPNLYKQAIIKKLTEQGEQKFKQTINYLQNNNTNDTYWHTHTLPYSKDLENRYNDKTKFINLLEKYIN